MWVLGINNMHNAAAALIRDGKIVAAAEEVRFMRKRTCPDFINRRSRTQTVSQHTIRYFGVN